MLGTNEENMYGHQQKCWGFKDRWVIIDLINCQCHWQFFMHFSPHLDSSLDFSLNHQSVFDVTDKTSEAPSSAYMS